MVSRDTRYQREEKVVPGDEHISERRQSGAISERRETGAR